MPTTRCRCGSSTAHDTAAAFSAVADADTTAARPRRLVRELGGGGSRPRAPLLTDAARLRGLHPGGRRRRRDAAREESQRDVAAPADHARVGRGGRQRRLVGRTSFAQLLGRCRGLHVSGNVRPRRPDPAGARRPRSTRLDAALCASSASRPRNARRRRARHPREPRRRLRATDRAGSRTLTGRTIASRAHRRRRRAQRAAVRADRGAHRSAGHRRTGRGVGPRRPAAARRVASGPAPISAAARRHSSVERRRSTDSPLRPRSGTPRHPDHPRRRRPHDRLDPLIDLSRRLGDPAMDAAHARRGQHLRPRRRAVMRVKASGAVLAEAAGRRLRSRATLRRPARLISDPDAGDAEVDAFFSAIAAARRVAGRRSRRCCTS